MLLELINENVIELGVKANNFEDAIKKAGQLLVNDGKVEEKYIDSMIEVANDIKGYIVIAPGIALPHARPEYGAKEIGLSLITLDEPINFGNEANDPVRVVIPLAAKDSKSHLELLQELSVLLDHDDLVEKFTDCNKKEEILDLIKEYTK